MAEVHHNGGGFGDDFFAVQKVGEVGGGVFLDELGFHDIEPLISGLLSEEFLVVGDVKMFKQESDSFGEASDVPVA
jgi:hypothetical protein